MTASASKGRFRHFFFQVRIHLKPSVPIAPRPPRNIVLRSHTHDRELCEGLSSCFTAICTDYVILLKSKLCCDVSIRKDEHIEGRSVYCDVLQFDWAAKILQQGFILA